MSATLTQAYDDILGTFKTAWDLVSTLPVLYPNRPGEAPTGDDSNDNPEGYAKLSITHNEGFQATLSDASAGKRWRSTGLVIAEIYYPSGTGTGYTTLVTSVIEAFRGVTTVNGVIFRRVAPSEIGLRGNYFQNNVIAAFEYDEIA